MLAAAPLVACASAAENNTARLTARPAAAGTTKLVLMLHGAGGRGARVMQNNAQYAERFRFTMIAPDSRGTTWDVIHGGWGPDVANIDGVLANAFRDLAVDPRHVAIAGFSDGASYALSLGLTNGDLFSHVIAFSPGFIVSPTQHGRPRIFIAHGTEDEILPVNNTRYLVKRLRDDRYDVTYHEFKGPHRVLPDVANAGFAWFAGSV